MTDRNEITDEEKAEMDARDNASVERWERITAAFDGAGQPLTPEEDEDFSGAGGFTPETTNRAIQRLSQITDGATRNAIAGLVAEHFRAEGSGDGADLILVFGSGPGKTGPILTPEQVAQVQAQADPQPETLPAPASQTSKWIGIACKSQAKGARHRTRCNLETTTAMVKGIESEMLQGAHSHQDIDGWRKSAIALFAAPLSLVTGESLTAKKLQNEWLPIHYMVSLLPEESQRRAAMVNWESLRVLARWAIHVVNEPLFSPHEVYEEQWRIQDGCESKLIELISTLSRVPMARDKLAKEMDRIERELSGAAEPIPAPRDDQKILNRFFEGIADRVAKMKMDGAELYKQLVHRKLISPPDFGSTNLATMTTQQAEALADAIGATGNVAAAAALVTRLRPYLMVAGKPSGPVGASADSLGGMSREIRKSA